MQYAKCRIISESKTNTNCKQFTVDFIFVKTSQVQNFPLAKFYKIKTVTNIP